MARFFAAGVLLLGPSQALAAPGTATSMLTVLLSLALILGGFVAIAWFARPCRPTTCKLSRPRPRPSATD